MHDGPAGPWSALEIKYINFICADVGDVLEQYVDNIGMVRRVVQTYRRSPDLRSGLRACRKPGDRGREHRKLWRNSLTWS